MNAVAETSNPMQDPISLVLYSFSFRTGPVARHLADAVLALTKGVPAEVVRASLSAIQVELDKPSQVVSRLLPGAMKSEAECRTFLRLVAEKINSLI